MSGADAAPVDGRSTYAELQEAMAREHFSSSVEWRTKWFLSLAIGNGAGGIGLTSALINGWKLGLWFQIMPGLWCFGLGLIAAGLIPFLKANAFGVTSRSLSYAASVTRGQGGIDDDGDPLDPGVVMAPLVKSAGRWHWLVGAAQVVAAVGFALGILWPLGSLTFVGARPL